MFWHTENLQEQCLVIDLCGTLVRGVGNTTLFVFFKYLFYSFSGPRNPKDAVILQ